VWITSFPPAALYEADCSQPDSCLQAITVIDLECDQKVDQQRVSDTSLRAVETYSYNYLVFTILARKNVKNEKLSVCSEGEKKSEAWVVS